jgi:parallel beta-helix repeat protein
MKTISPLLWLAVFSLFAISIQATTFYVDVNSANPTPPYTDLTTAAVSVQDAVDAATNGDLVLVNDGVYQDGFRVTQEWVASDLQPKTISVTNRIVVNKSLTVQSLNGPSAAFISGGGIYRCAYLTNGAVLSGFTLMNGAAGWISTTQSFIGRIVTTTNIVKGGGVACMAALGSIMATVSNCVLTANTATGDGGGAYYVNLINCTLTGNTAMSGGGAYDSALVACVVTGNSAQSTGLLNPGGLPYPTTLPGVGGGLYLCSAVNCLIANNTAFEGGGVYGATGIGNCTIVNNSAAFYGGICLNGVVFSPYAYATNCIIYFNTAGTNANFGATNFFSDHCCTFPQPASGAGNITNDPAFVDYSGGDFHLQTNSPCINSGCNAAITNSTDLDGNPRIAGGIVDIGAYEFQSPTSVLSYAWLQQYGLPTDGSADFVDSDGDGMNNWQEFIAGTNPTNTASVLQMTSVVPQRSLNLVVVKWQSVNTRSYYLMRSSELGTSAGFSIIASNIVGETGSTVFFDTTATNGGSYFYRVGVQ